MSALTREQRETLARKALETVEWGPNELLARCQEGA